MNDRKKNKEAKKERKKRRNDNSNFFINQISIGAIEKGVLRLRNAKLKKKSIHAKKGHEAKATATATAEEPNP